MNNSGEAIPRLEKHTASRKRQSDTIKQLETTAADAVGVASVVATAAAAAQRGLEILDIRCRARGAMLEIMTDSIEKPKGEVEKIR